MFFFFLNRNVCNLIKLAPKTRSCGFPQKIKNKIKAMFWQSGYNLINYQINCKIVKFFR